MNAVSFAFALVAPLGLPAVPALPSHTVNGVFTLLVAFFGIGGSLVVLASAVAMFRARDALSRINVFSPVTGLGMPMILVASYCHSLWAYGFDLWRTFVAVVSFMALIAVSSVASNVLSRASFVSGSPVSRKTIPNRLAYARNPEEDSKLIALNYLEEQQAQAEERARQAEAERAREEAGMPREPRNLRVELDGAGEE